MPHTLLLAEPRGFCAGVVRAIDVLDEAGASQYLLPISKRKKIITTKDIE